MEMLDWATGALVGIPATMGLACVALVGYVFGRRTRKQPEAPTSSSVPRELHKAARVARQLEDTIEQLRQQVAEHRAHVHHFKTAIDDATGRDAREALDILASESELVIMPTLRLASRLSHAYDQLRQQSQTLSNFTEGRTDPVTGMGNTPALEEQMELLLGDRVHGGQPAGLALISVAPPSDATPGGDFHRDFVRRVATEIERCVRAPDYIARLGGSEFAVLMPQTSLAGARVFGTRLRQQLADKRGMVAGCGIAEAMDNDTAQSWLARADSALYSARAEGAGGQYLHTGEFLQADNQPLAPSTPQRELDLADAI